MMGRRADQRELEYLQLLSRLEDEDDPRQSYAELQMHIRRYRAAGAPVPEPLAIAERQLMTELTAQSQGR